MDVTTRATRATQTISDFINPIDCSIVFAHKGGSFCEVTLFFVKRCVIAKIAKLGTPIDIDEGPAVQ